MLVKCLIGKNQGLNSNHKVQTSNLKVQRIRSSKITLMTTVANCGLSLQITRQLVNSSTRTLVNLTKWGYPAFHAPPYGGGVGGGASWVALFFSSYNKLSPNIAFFISFSCSKTKRATMALSRAVEGNFTLVADFRRSRTPLRSESI